MKYFGIAVSAILAVDLAQSLILVSLPAYRQHLGMTALQVGLVLGVPHLVIMLLAPLCGRRIESAGSARLFTLLGSLFAASGTALYGLAITALPRGSQLGFWVVLTGGLCQGAAVAAITPAILASLAGALAPEERSGLLARMYTVSGLGMLLVPIVVALLFLVLDVRWAVWLISALMLPYGFVLYSLHDRYFACPRGEADAQSDVLPRKEPAFSGRDILLFASASLAMFNVGAFEVVSPIRLVSELGFSPSTLGLYLSALGMLFVVPQLWAERWYQDGEPRWPALVGSIGLVVGLFFLGSLERWAFAVGVMAVVPFLGLIYSSAVGLASRTETAARSSSWLEAGVSGGFLSGSLVGGCMLDLWGLRGAIAGTMLISLVGALTVNILRWRLGHQH